MSLDVHHHLIEHHARTRESSNDARSSYVDTENSLFVTRLARVDLCPRQSGKEKETID